MQRAKWFTMIRECVAQWQHPRCRIARRRTPGLMSAAVESLEPRCLRAAGALDPAFGVGGRVTTEIIKPTANYARGMTIQSDGKIVVVGQVEAADGSHSSFAIVRYNTDGSLDSSLRGTGKVTTDVGVMSSAAHGVVIQNDAKIVVAGYAEVSGSSIDFAVVRYNADGTLDTTFDGDGKVTTGFGTFADDANGIALQTDGKIVVAGYAGGPRNDFALARYNGDGTLDSTFDGDGKVTADLGTTDNRA